MAALWLAVGAPAHAQTGTGSDMESDEPEDRMQPAMPETREATPGGETTPKTDEAAEQKSAQKAETGLWERDNLFPDPGGLRSNLASHGITIGLTESEEVFGNATGGTRQGVAYEALTQMGLGIDTGKAFGLADGTFNVTAYQIHGRGS